MIILEERISCKKISISKAMAYFTQSQKIKLNDIYILKTDLLDYTFLLEK